jgi:hypothetical protein
MMNSSDAAHLPTDEHGQRAERDADKREDPHSASISRDVHVERIDRQ